MKHGKKSEQTSVKSPTRKEGSKATVRGRTNGAPASSKAEARRAGSSSKEPAQSGREAKGKRPANDGDAGFTNANVAEAFGRAIKKYSNAFRRLTD